MDDLRDRCAEWLDEPGTDETDLDDLVSFVQAQRLDAARNALERLAQIFSYSGLNQSRAWQAVEVIDAIRTIRDSIEREEA